MNKKSKIMIILLIIFLIGIIVGNQIYKKANQFENVLTCKYINNPDYYSEKLIFQFDYDILYMFKREEHIKEYDDKTLDDIYKEYNKKKEELDEQDDTIGSDSEYFKYEVTKESDDVKILTQYKTLYTKDSYNEFIESLNIDFDSTIDEIKSALKDNYECTLEVR